MTFLPLILGAGRVSGAEVRVSGKRSNLKTETEKTLRQDDYTCRYCGFHSQKYQRAIPVLDDKGVASLVTTCTFCELVLNLERAGMMGSGVLIWLPEIDQISLNHMARAIYVARSAKGPVADLAIRALDALMARRAEAKKRLGGDDPLLLATVLVENLTADEMKDVMPKLEGLRLLPLDKYAVRTAKGYVDQFPDMVAYWQSSEGPYAQLPVEKWADLFRAA